jgi:hypothetical protein
MIDSLLNTTVDVMRRVSVGRDTLNNPTYGNATSGAGWSRVYKGLRGRMAFSEKELQFHPTSERITPIGVFYFNSPTDPDFSIQHEDRLITEDKIEYIVVDLAIGYLIGDVVDHHEAILALP